MSTHASSQSPESLPQGPSTSTVPRPRQPLSPHARPFTPQGHPHLSTSTGSTPSHQLPTCSQNSKRPLSNRARPTSSQFSPSSSESQKTEGHSSRNQVFPIRSTLRDISSKINSTLHSWFTPTPNARSQRNPVARFGSLEVLGEEVPPPATRHGHNHQALPGNFSPEFLGSVDPIPLAQPSQDNIQDIWQQVGNPLPPIDKTTTLRIIYQNTCHSLQPDASPPTAHMLQNLQELDCGVFCAAETNVNWRNKATKNCFRDVLSRSGWRNAHVSTACSIFGTFDEHKTKRYLPGGTATLSFDIWASKITDSGEDPADMGRWNFVSYKGKADHTLTVITGYRTCRAGPYSGPSTAHSQQTYLLNRRHHKSPHMGGSPEAPRQAFLHDLRVLILHLQALNHKIILCLDGNETPKECQGPHGRLKENTLDHFLAELGLEEVFQCHHDMEVHTSTTTPNRFIDRVAVWNIPLLRVTRLPVNTPARSDHLAFAIDLDVFSLFGGQLSQLAGPGSRKLTTKNIQTRDAYITEVSKQCTNHKILDRIQHLSQVAESGTFSAADRETFFQLDQQFMEIRLGAEHKCSKRTTPRLPWSPALKQTGKAIVYWQHRVSMPLHLPDAKLIQIGIEGRIAPGIHLTLLSKKECRGHLKTAWQEYQLAKKTASAIRDEHLLQRALETQQNGGLTEADCIQAIRRTEATNRSFRRIARAMGKTKQPLTHLETTTPEGETVLLQDGPSIHEALKDFNQTHFRQANETPFGSYGPGATYVDPDSPDYEADSILDGTFQPWPDIDPITATWIQALQAKAPPSVSLDITVEDFKSHFRKTNEGKASSPSGLHVGHYIVAAKQEDDLLALIVTTIARVALLTASPPPRWRRCIQIMLEKGKGPKLGKLRTIQLIEADLNFVLKLIWGHRLNQAVHKTNLYNDAQFAVPGRLCTSAVLSKVLFVDLLRQTGQTGSIVDNDAKACFDRVLPALALITCRSLGLPKAAAYFLFVVLRQMVFNIGTGHGISECSYAANADPANPGQGSGQGFGSGPMLWNSTGNVNLETYATLCPGAAFLHPDPGRHADVFFHSACYVDDTTQLTNDLGIEVFNEQTDHPPASSDIVTCTMSNTQTYSEILWTSGGQLAPDKCNVYILKPTGRVGTRGFASTIDLPGTVEVSLNPAAPPIPLNRLEPNEAHRTLGVHFAPDGSTTTQIQLLQQKITKWRQGSLSHGLSDKDRWRAFDTCLKPALLYPLVGHSIQHKDLIMIQKMLDTPLANALHLNGHFPRAILHGPTRFGGIAIPTIAQHHWADKIITFLHHIRANDTVGKQLHISLAHTQLEVGSDNLFLSLDYTSWGALATPTWITHIWESMSLADLHIDCLPGECWLPTLQRENDAFIMDLATPFYAKAELTAINWCRIYLNLLTLADLSLGNGRKIHPAYLDVTGHPGRTSLLNWPAVPAPPPEAIVVWRAFLYTNVIDRFGCLHSRLGRWLPDVKATQKNPFLWYDDVLYRLSDEGPRRLLESTASRSRRRKFLDCPIPIPIGDFLTPPLLADTFFTDGLIEVLDVYQAVPVPQPAAVAPPAGDASFPDFVERVTSIGEKRLLGSVSFPPQGCDAISTAMSDRQILGVSDGSVKHGKGTHAWIITPSATSPLRITGAGPVDGSRDSMTSYRAELQGQLAVSLMVILLAQFFQIQKGHVVSVSDNKGTLKRLARNEQTRFNTHKESSADLLLMHSSLRNRIPTKMAFRLQRPPQAPGRPEEALDDDQDRITLTYTWVKGHQDMSKSEDELTQHERLNIEMDSLAEGAHTLPPGLRSSQTSYILPGEKWAVFYNESKITSGLKTTLLMAFQEDATTAYLRRKYGFTEPTMASVGWHYIESLFTKKTAHRRALLAKYIHGWAPTAAFLQKQGRDAPACPFCLTQERLPTHFLTCPDEAARKTREAAWVKCTTHLSDVARSCPLIIDVMDRKVRALLHLAPRRRPRGIGRPRAAVLQALNHAEAAQDVIGWDLFLRGFLAVEWERAQVKYARGVECASTIHPPPWGQTIVQQVVQFGLTVWTSRNEKLHGKTITEQAEITRRLVHTKVSELYEQRPTLHPRFPAIMEISLETRLTFPTTTLQSWLRQVAEQLVWTQRKREHDLRTQHRITNWFRPLPRDPDAP